MSSGDTHCGGVGVFEVAVVEDVDDVAVPVEPVVEPVAAVPVAAVPVAAVPVATGGAGTGVTCGVANGVCKET
jgi:hypothetical protein